MLHFQSHREDREQHRTADTEAVVSEGEGDGVHNIDDNVRLSNFNNPEHTKQDSKRLSESNEGDKKSLEEEWTRELIEKYRDLRLE